MKKLIRRTLKLLSKYYIYLIVFISFLGTAGSLMMSEMLNLTPCDLCWYQRVFMYGVFTVTLTAVLIKDEADAHKYVIGLSIPGALIAIYNYYIQLFPQNQFIGGCQIDNPCTKIEFQLFGFLTIPLMSFIAFVAILILSYIRIKLNRVS
jgi:disulfide bond formation protein DsbB